MAELWKILDASADVVVGALVVGAVVAAVLYKKLWNWAKGRFNRAVDVAVEARVKLEVQTRLEELKQDHKKELEGIRAEQSKDLEQLKAQLQKRAQGDALRDKTAHEKQVKAAPHLIERLDEMALLVKVLLDSPTLDTRAQIHNFFSGVEMAVGEFNTFYRPYRVFFPSQTQDDFDTFFTAIRRLYTIYVLDVVAQVNEGKEYADCAAEARAKMEKLVENEVRPSHKQIESHLRSLMGIETGGPPDG